MDIHALKHTIVRALLASYQSECERVTDEALAELDAESLAAIAAGYPIDPLHLKLGRERGWSFSACLAEIAQSHAAMAELDAARAGVIASRGPISRFGRSLAASRS